MKGAKVKLSFKYPTQENTKEELGQDSYPSEDCEQDKMHLKLCSIIWKYMTTSVL